MKKTIILFTLFGFSLGYMTFFLLNDLESSKTQMEMAHTGHEEGEMHMHEQIEVNPDLPLPVLDVELIADDKSGYNVRIQTENYLFVPEQVNQENMPNEGHAHIYVNNEKVGRVYSEWYHIDEHYMQKGENTIRVTLNAHDHSEWSQEGVSIDYQSDFIYE